jgi:Fe-Mn family superoxide dismutase
MAFELPSLPYSSDALEPHIDARTMEIHHGKHHAAYTTKLNAALDGKTSLSGQSIEGLLRNLQDLPSDIRGAVQNNGGGYANHNLFWTVMSATGGGSPSGSLGAAIKNELGGFDQFKTSFSDAAANQFGSGWAWLALGDSGRLKVYSTANQDSPFSLGDTPILGLDVWEHAYYLKYQNLRPDYITAFWNVVDWGVVAENYTSAK